jgi:hypothetical protein
MKRCGWALVLFTLAGCKTTTLKGTVVSCADKKPIDHATITMVEADPDPKKTNVTANYYYGGTNKDGTFEVGGYGDPKTTYWTAKATKDGYTESAARYEPGAGPQNICLEPTASAATKQ